MENKGRRYQTFVANRVSEISEQSSPTQWKYVETNLNPTDDASRGLTVDAIVGSNRWCMGPCFLWQNEDSWPQRPAAMYHHREEELRTSEENTTTFLSVAHPANQVINKLFERFSLRFQLKKCVAWMPRWNEIPLRIRMADSIRCFKHNMWTNIFSQQQFLSHFRV